MALKETVNTLKSILSEIGYDLEKANGGNKAASQRVRTASIRFEKVAKVYRKESVASEKKAPAKAVRATKVLAKKTVMKKSSTKKAAPKSTKASKSPARKRR